MFRIIGNEFLDWKFYALFFPMLFLYGICIGSFLNVVIFRLPQNESLVKRSSHCMTCGAKIRKRDLIPVFSWLFLRGKCHACGKKISPRYPVVETLNALVYIAAILRFDTSAQGLLMCLFYSLLIIIGFMDWDTMEMDPWILGLIAVLCVPLALLTDTLTIPQRILGGLCISVPFFLLGEIVGAYMKHKHGEKVRGIELGDTLLMLAGGLLLGWQATVASAAIGIFLGAVCGVIMKLKTGESKIAFGPFLAIGLFLGSLFGDAMVQHYISFLTSSMQP